jgi:heptosyltransferase-2
MVMSQSLFKLLKSRRPEAPIDVLAPGWSLPIIARMPEVRAGLVSPGGHGQVAMGDRRRLGIALREKGYGQAIVLPRSLKAALVPWFARIPRRTGIRGEMRFGLINDMRPFEPRLLDQTVKRFVALGLEADETVREIPRPALRVLPERRQAAIERLNLATDRPVVAMMPGAEYGPAKCWPIEYFRDLARLLVAEGFAVWVFGSARDRPAGTAIATDGHVHDLCGLTELEEVVDLLEACRYAVTNDSGLMHVAAAVGTPVIALYGSTTPDFTPPLTDDARIHYLRLDCSPCFERRCPLGHLRCLRGIRPAAVLADIVEMPESPG